ncbi:hypothetical protein NQ318_009798 [Aromia moschata]|uniref:Uncharacterized protein n=1 Tax=Aromia moschata TaxID=1265417 RepID=A0AAV8XLH9_9CUCU|nr:hypothetical protein NQ318_009798 [Aromia moschata]
MSFYVQVYCDLVCVIKIVVRQSAFTESGFLTEKVQNHRLEFLPMQEYDAAWCTPAPSARVDPGKNAVSVGVLKSLCNVERSAREFKEGRETTEDDLRPTTTSKTDGNIEEIGKSFREYRRLSIRGLALITGIVKEYVRQILHESFNMRKVCARMVLKLLTLEHKESRMNICADILNNIDTDPGLLDTVTLKGTRFESVEAVKAKATEVLNQLTEADFQHCFQQWKSRMERCKDRQGEYIEGEKVATVRDFLSSGLVRIPDFQFNLSNCLRLVETKVVGTPFSDYRTT